MLVTLYIFTISEGPTPKPLVYRCILDFRTKIFDTVHGHPILVTLVFFELHNRTVRDGRRYEGRKGESFQTRIFRGQRERLGGIPLSHGREGAGRSSKLCLGVWRVRRQHRLPSLWRCNFTSGAPRQTQAIMGRHCMDYLTVCSLMKNLIASLRHICSQSGLMFTIYM